MSNQYRLKLEIKLKYIDKGINKENYILIIKVIKKDNRFDVKADKDGDYTSYIYTASNDFSIGTNSYNFKGNVGKFHFAIPNKKYLNRRLIGSFMTDDARKTYLRHLHKALIEWANNWGSFSTEPNVKFKAMNNKWYFYITK